MTATSRTSKIVSENNGQKIHNLYGGPIYYKDKFGNYKDINLNFSDSSSSVGNITLRDKHSSSIGIRKDNNKTKYLGIRPDETQEDGTNQMEWSIINVEFDGVSQNIDLSKNDIDKNIIDLGSIAIESTKLYTRQLVKYNGTATDFKIEFDMHLKNMSIANDKYDGSYEFRKPCSLNITDIGEDIGDAAGKVTDAVTGGIWDRFKWPIIIGGVVIVGLAVFAIWMRTKKPAPAPTPAPTPVQVVKS